MESFNGNWTLAENVAAAERDHVQRVMRIVGGRKKEAAAMLGISMATLYRKLIRCGTGPDRHGMESQTGEEYSPISEDGCQ